MKEAGAVAIILFAMLSAAVLAEPSVVFAPQAAYETNSVSFDINMSNWGSDYDIISVSANLPGFDISYQTNYQGWIESYSGSTIAWTDGSISNNVILAVFEFLAEAQPVSANTTQNAVLTLTDSNLQDHTYTFPITIYDDNSPPSLTDILPLDGGLIKQGTTDYVVQVNATDPETGIANVTLHWVQCDFSENITPTDHTLQLAQYSGLYRNTIDLSAYHDGQHICYDFTAYNRGGERSQYSGKLTIDGVPPDVTLVSPVDSATTGLSRNFSFFAADNLATQMTCTMYIDGAEYMKDIEASHMDIVYISSADVAEGNHTWSMRCEDPAGWEGNSATWSYILDKTPPQIEMTTPANNSAINGQQLSFSVTDNAGLWRVWLVVDGNATQVDGEFTIDTTDWPDGPNEFAVRAQDNVHNQAERTYRVIIDRNPPQVEPVSPADNGESDVHANLTYRALDDYSNEMDCTVYIDNAGKQQHKAQQGTETTWPTILAIGEHRWKVQCVDEAGNIGESDERQLSVNDYSGPDIAMDIPEEVFRGNPVQLSLTVTDISGVDAVEATLTGPHDSAQTIPLERVGEAYIATIETTTSSETGTYTLSVRAVDTLNHSSQTEGQYELTYRVVVATELEPETAAPGTPVTLSGIVQYDNGTAISSGDVTLNLPNETVQAAPGDDGAFSHGFTAPVLAGEYNVTSLVLAENGKEFTSIRTLTVQLPQLPHIQSGSSGGGSGGLSNDDGKTYSLECDTDWSCIAWSPCENGEQERICVDLNECSDDNRKAEQRLCTATTEKTEEQKNDKDDKTGAGDTVSASREPLPKPEKYTAHATSQDQGSAAGIGKASGFMSNVDISASNVLFALLLMTILLGVLYHYGWGKGDGRKRPHAVDMLGRASRVELDSYLEQRAARRR